MSPTIALTEEFTSVRKQTEKLVAALSAEDMQVQSMPDASPSKWHLAHTSWFFETFVLERYEPDFTPFDGSYRVLFNSYYEGIGEQFPRHQRGLITQPTLTDVIHYRRNIDERIDDLIRKSDGAKGVIDLVTLGLHHEQQHQELMLTDIKHTFSANRHRGRYARRPTSRAQPAVAQTWLSFDAGVVPIGHDPSRDGAFSFDNESPRHRVFLEPFQLATRPVTIGEYVAFMDDGGYHRPELWLALGWDWVQRLRRCAPLYWFANAQSSLWQRHTLHGPDSSDPSTPICHLTYFEADAYARWAGARLPTEAEWEHAARSISLQSMHEANLAHQGIFEPRAASVATGGELLQMFGDVWEWTSSSYGPYPGYRPAAGAVGEYNGKFMCNQYVLRGGSCATPLGHIRASYRNFFPADAGWQFTGLRLARSE